jgi:hypothetical protein
MEVDNGNIKEDLQVIKVETEDMGFAGKNENDTWQHELRVDYKIKKTTKCYVSEILICYINGCENIRTKDKCLCDEHL